MYRAITRSLLQAWGHAGLRSGWRYRCIERFGASLSSGMERLPRRLPNGTVVHCDLRDHVQRHLYFWGAYEPVESWLSSRLIKKGDVVIDGGANIGQYSMLASTIVGDDGIVHAFEPVAANYAQLQSHLRINHLHNVLAHELGLWRARERLVICRPHDTGGANAGSFTVTPVTRWTERAEVDMIDLDEFFRLQPLSRLDFVKIDIEGSELAALEGMQGLLRQFHPLILAEVNRPLIAASGVTPEDLWKLLVEQLGYCVWEVSAGGASRPVPERFGGIERANILCFLGSPPEPLLLTPSATEAFRWARSRGRQVESLR